ncbi:sigma 54-interacting transcriptional regulator [Anaerovoracaceae bacterium 42-11]|nr:sigma 54-interacting transcriptional regulator [Emergencia sp.]
MLRRYAEQIMNLYNFIDGMMIVNADAKVEYFSTYRPDVNLLKEKNLIGRYLLDIYPSLTEESSSIIRVLRTGKPIFNEYQVLSTYDGQNLRAVNTTLPIKEGDTIVGAVDVSRYIDSDIERQDIVLQMKEAGDVKTMYTIDDIVTSSMQMEIIKKRIPMIADTDSSVLIYGETGTGKELVAQSIHTSSKRKNRRFVSQNCASIPENLLESILFGTVKGSYTGAENRPGLFEMAAGGTLFLDEINSMETSVQAKILKAIEEKQITRVGGLSPIPIDVKIVSAINQQPMECVRTGKLREDLFYRLSVVQLSLPPLRERLNDLFFLVSHFIGQYNEKMHRKILGIDEEVENLFRRYPWPGNVRELKNIIEGAFNVTDAAFIQLKDLPEYLFTAAGREPDYMGTSKPAVNLDDPDFSIDKAMSDFEISIIEKALAQTRTMSDAAKKLKISKQALNYKMNKYGINH